MADNVQVRSGGIGFAGLLAILFIALKLTGVAPVATWSWWWVLSPLWIGTALALGIVGIVLVFTLVLAGIAAVISRFAPGPRPRVTR